MYCKECGAEIGHAKFCPECGTNANDSTAQYKNAENYQTNTEQKLAKSDEIIDFRAVTVTASITFFISILLYSYTPTFAFIIGALIGGLTMGILFSNKLNNKTRGISGFVGALIALIILAVLLSY
jgi:hypothetical protein